MSLKNACLSLCLAAVALLSAATAFAAEPGSKSARTERDLAATFRLEAKAAGQLERKVFDEGQVQLEATVSAEKDARANQ